MRFFKSLINKVLLKFFNATLTRNDPSLKISYAEEGEDLMLARIFDGKKSGFYVDVGAHHPKQISNTYYFYLKGWRGINIDATPGSMDIFEILRPRDINLELAISSEEKELTFYRFNAPALNGFSKELTELRKKIPGFEVIEEVKIRSKILSKVLDEHLPHGQTIDFFTIDVEGLDLDVLKSNDWDKYAPNIILAECLNLLIADAMVHPVVSFLDSKGYELYAKGVNTVYFKKKNFTF